MQNTIVHYEGTVSLEAVATKVKPSGAVIKIGLDVHARLYVAVAQYDHLLPKAARRLRPEQFVPWVEELLRRGHTVHVVYETNELEVSAPSTLPRGVGKLTSVMLTREICDWHRFNNRRAISSYTGLCPGERTSGSKRVPGSVTKRGNPRVGAALVECAWRMVRFQPHFPPVQKRLAVLAKGSRAIGAVRKKAIVAVARRLAVDLWRLHTGRCTAEQLGLKL